MQWGSISEWLGGVWAAFLSAWDTPGVSEFLAALVGGAMTLLAQRWALKHDREKEEARSRDEAKARAWAIFFKIRHVFEVNAAVARDISRAKSSASAASVELWQTLQFPAHDWDRVDFKYEELLFLISNRQFDVMEDYQEAVNWCSFLIQSVKTYREMRIDFLSSVPSAMNGLQGTIAINPGNANLIMPRVAHLQSLSGSMEKLVSSKQAELLKLLDEYGAVMKQIIGERPNMTFTP